MKWYIIKPQSYETDQNLMDGIKEVHKDAEFTENLEEANRCVLQRGWCNSRSCARELQQAKDLRIRCEEGYLYTDRYSASTN